MSDCRAFEVTIRQAVHPITSDVLSQAFRSVGEIEHVQVNNPDVTPGGDTTVTGSVVFRDAASGAEAMSTLQGRAIYPNACFVELKPAPYLARGDMHHAHHHHHHHHHAHHHHHHHAMHHHHHGHHHHHHMAHHHPG